MKRALRFSFTLWLGLLLAHISLAQTRVVTGTVKDNRNQPVIGASVIVKGTTTGAYTDQDGKFSLAAPPDATVLTIRYVGMKVQDVTIGADNTVNVTMQTDVTGLDEVVVTANAINREKRSLGYATQQVSGEDVTRGRNTNPIAALEGKVSGVNITSLSGAPGASNRIVIRGGTSLTRSNQALMVIDGVPIDNSNNRTLTTDGSQPDDLQNQVDYGNRGNDINPDDIESISVLKGPAAAALYGSRASNGAILITTKKGRRGLGRRMRMDVTYNSNITFSSILKLPDFQNTYGQGNVDGIPDDRRENFSWGLPFDGQLRPWGQEINGQQRVKPYSALKNNIRNFFDLGKAYRNNISLSGGSDKNTFYMSLGSLRSTGIVPTSVFDKYTVLLNATSQISSKLSAGVSLNYSNISSVLPTGGELNQSVYTNLLQTPRDIPITEGKDLNNPFNKYDDVTGTYGFYGAYTVNPYWVLENYKNTNSVNRIFGNLNATYTPFKWLSITDRLGGDTYSDIRYEKWKSYNYVGIDPLYVDNSPITYAGKYSEDHYNFMSYNNDLMVTLQHSFTPAFSGTLLLGQNARQQQLDNTYAQTNDQGGLALPGYYNLSNSNGPALLRNSTNKTRNTGLYADLSLAYKKMLFLDLTGRRDRSSTIQINHGAYFYPSASLSWVFSELFPPSLKESIWTYGKLRASYAKVGNDAPAYLFDNTFGVTNIDGGFGSTQFPFGPVPGFTQGDFLPNPNIKPEFTTASEVGTELGFFKDRLGIDFSVYQNQSKDLIIASPISNASGYTNQYINVGVVHNNGVELAVRVTPVLTDWGFKWDFYGTYTKNTNKVVSLANGVDQIGLGGLSSLAVVAQVGQPYGVFYGTDLLKDPNGHVVVDSSGEPLLTTSGVSLGSYQPKYMASWGTTLSYKGLTFNILFDTKQGGKFFSETKDLIDFNGTALETEDRTDRIWPNSVYQDESGAYHPNTDFKYHPYEYWSNKSQFALGQHVIDGSFVKLREVSLGYTLMPKWLTKTPFGSVTISVFGNNLAIWTPKVNKFADPEENSSGSSNVQGFEFTANPSQRNYGVDLQVTF